MIKLIIYRTGRFEWYKFTSPKNQIKGNIALHRLNGPAVKDHTGYEAWYNDGCIHRTGGPAVSSTSGYTAYWVNNQRHRTDGPAIINQRHITDDPAIINRDEDQVEYWINGKILSEYEFMFYSTQESI